MKPAKPNKSLPHLVVNEDVKRAVDTLANVLGKRVGRFAEELIEIGVAAFVQKTLREADMEFLAFQKSKAGWLVLAHDAQYRESTLALRLEELTPDRLLSRRNAKREEFKKEIEPAAA